VITQKEIELPKFKRGFHIITDLIKQTISLEGNGILHIFIKHTSAGLMINENADPSVRVDFESVFNRLIPESEPYYTHISEGVDDMPSHVKSAIIGNSLSIPVTGGKLNLGIWQGIYLCEFRNHAFNRNLILTYYS
jgi:secondary thiamine-phosphate synthase enzyme